MSDDKTVSQVAGLLGVNHNTVRKWITLLENKGYAIKREQRGKLHVKILREEDINILRSVQDSVKQPNVTLEQAITSAIEATITIGQYEPPTDLMEVQHILPAPESISTIEARLNVHDKQLEAQLAFNKELVGRLERNQRFIEESIQRRDEQLTQVMRGFLEAASARANDEVEVRKRRWWKFGKR